MVGDFFSNREIYEMLQGLKDELQETRHLVRQYNGLLERVSCLAQRVAEVEAAAKGAAEFEARIVKWGGFIIGALGVGSAIVAMIWG